MVCLANLLRHHRHLVNLLETNQEQEPVYSVIQPVAPPQCLGVSPLAPQQLQEGLVGLDHQVDLGLDLGRAPHPHLGLEVLGKVLVLDKHQGKIRLSYKLNVYYQILSI